MAELTIKKRISPKPALTSTPRRSAPGRWDTLFVVYPFGFITPIHWRTVGIVCAYCLVWPFMGELAKLTVQGHLEMGSRRHKTFLRVLKYCTHPFAR